MKVFEVVAWSPSVLKDKMVSERCFLAVNTLFLSFGALVATFQCFFFHFFAAFFSFFCSFLFLVNPNHKHEKFN